MESDSIEPSMLSVKGIAILDQDGKRILAKYYDKDSFPSVKQQKELESKLFAKTQRANAEIIMMEGGGDEEIENYERLRTMNDIFLFNP